MSWVRGASTTRAPGENPSSCCRTCSWSPPPKSTRSPNCWPWRGRRVHRAAPAPARLARQANIGWLLPTQPQQQRTITGAAACSRSCTLPPSAVNWAAPSLAAGAVLKAFERAKAAALELLDDIGHQSHLALRRGESEGRARIDGRGFLALWRCIEPEDPETFVRRHHARGPVGTRGQGGRVFPSLDLRELQGLALCHRVQHRHRLPHDKNGIHRFTRSR